MLEHLYIIGNGFDLHHKYRSGLTDYGRWLMENRPNIYYSFEEWFDIPVYDEDDVKYDEWKNWWSYFEQRLGEIAIRQYIEDASYRAFNEASQVEERRAYHTYAGERIAGNELSNFISNIKGTFSEWIQTLKHGEKWFRLPIDSEALFLSFNYTRTLESIYNIPNDRILHIHGSINSGEYILGHGLSYQEIETRCDNDEECPDDIPVEHMEEWYTSHSDDFMTNQVKEIAIERMLDLRKDVESIIAENRDFFDKLNDIRVIHIYGFSFSPIDMAYIYKIISKIDMINVKWEISFLTDNDKGKVDDFIQNANIPLSKVSTIKLTDIHLDPQLKISFD